MYMTGSELAPHIRIILSKDRDWHSVSRRACRCWFCRFRYGCDRRLAITRLTRRALLLMHAKAKVSVRHGRGRHAEWLYVSMSFGTGTNDYPKVRADVRDMLTALGVRYATYDHPPFGRRLCIRLSINGNRSRRL